MKNASKYLNFKWQKALKIKIEKKSTMASGKSIITKDITVVQDVLRGGI